ncbi:MAG: hypothetical protein SGARI_005524, partial [Bacillariaceae sp.]
MRQVSIFDLVSGTDIVTIKSRTEEDGIENKEKAIGQIFDFMKTLELFGHPNVFGVLTTFTESWVFWLDDESSKIAANENRFAQEHILKLMDSLRKSQSSSTQSLVATPKPPSAEQMEQDSKPKTSARKAYRSDRYEAHQLVPLLCNAIFCGLSNIQQKRSPLDVEALAGKRYQFRRVLKLYDTKDDDGASDRPSYEFLKDVVVPIKGSTIDKRQEQPAEFLVVDKIGAGSTSRALRAVTQSGFDCVIKMYVRKHDGNSPLTDKEFRQAGYDSVTREADQYQKIYPGLESNVWATNLNNFHRLILPYFRPIPKEERRSEEVLNGIRKALKSFETHNLCFAEEDVLWRHVGTYEETIYLFDLANLVQGPMN